MPFPTRERRSTQIAETILQHINGGVLKPGDRLPTETNLCKTHNVSRTTLREAIQMLRTQGLLDVTPGRGSFIRKPDNHRWMHELAQACNLGGVLPEHILPLRALLQRNVLRDLIQTEQKIRINPAHLLHPANDAPTNAAHEVAWCLDMAEQGGNPLQTMLIRALCILDTPSIQTRFTDTKYLLRTATLQRQTMDAMSTQSWPKAEFALAHYFLPPVISEEGVMQEVVAARLEKLSQVG